MQQHVSTYNIRQAYYTSKQNKNSLEVTRIARLDQMRVHPAQDAACSSADWMFQHIKGWRESPGGAACQASGTLHMFWCWEIKRKVQSCIIMYQIHERV